MPNFPSSGSTGITGPSRRTDLRWGPSCRRDGDASRPDENPGYHRTEDESTDVGEERDTTATRVGGVDEPVVAFEELVEEPAAEEEPRRDAYWEPQHQRAYA